MALETDLLLDRRRLKRGLARWRVVALVALAAALVFALGLRRGALGGRHVARITVAGVIASRPPLLAALRHLAADRSVAALIVAVDSPGGSVAGGEALHDAIARIAAVKPVVVVMRGMAASAGYMIAVPAARIFARGTTITGAIGVILETGEISGLLRHLGITADAIVSAPLKGQPSFTAPLSSRGRTVLQDLVDNLAAQFVAMVAAGRHLPLDRVRKLADGRAYTGQQALKLGLIDEIGGERAARLWLARSRGVPLSLPMRDLGQPGWSAAGFGASLMAIWKMLLSQRLSIDGPVALWQPYRP